MLTSLWSGWMRRVGSLLLAVVALVSLAPATSAHIVTEAPWHPLAYAYRTATFLINLRPTDWALVERTFTIAGRAGGTRRCREAISGGTRRGDRRGPLAGDRAGDRGTGSRRPARRGDPGRLAGDPPPPRRGRLASRRAGRRHPLRSRRHARSIAALPTSSRRPIPRAFATWASPGSTSPRASAMPAWSRPARGRPTRSRLPRRAA